MFSHDPRSCGAPLRPTKRVFVLVAGLMSSLAAGAALAQMPVSDPLSATSGPIRSAPPMRGFGPKSLTDLQALRAPEPSMSVQQEDAPWVLAPEQHPWPLRYSAPAGLNTLLLDVPAVPEARLMLPGRLADAVENARFAANKYLTDAIGMAVQARRRQAEQLEEWLERVALQAREVDQDEWPQYQFNREARKTMSEYREQLVGQSGAGMQRLVTDAQDAIARMNDIMAVMPTHELSMGWYNIMVQLRNGVAMYQSQVEQSDARTLELADTFLAQTPELPRPRGPLPAQSKPGLAPPAPVATAAALSAPPLPSPAPAPEVQAPAEKQDSLGGLVVMGGVLAAIFFLARRLRRRAPAVKSPA